MAEQKKEFTYKYVYPSDLRDYYVTGLYGGVTPRHEINIHFYNERHPIPKTATFEMAEDGTLTREIAVDLGGDAVRVIQTSITMDLGTAISIRNWLNDRIDFIQNLGSKPKEGE